ncbi:glycosyltransferase family 1 protein [Actinoplanes sp. NPDC049265]|uniref:glycosyltransferase family 1 protein n=1 Tax=Actinoplanes sp. NPDC049265 TaxID=3363902 RepID=UPI003723C3CE
MIMSRTSDAAMGAEVINVLVVAATTPGRPAAFAESMRRLADAGADVTLIVGDEFPLSRRYRAMTGTKGQKLWWRAAADARLRTAAARADVLVALDAAAVHTVWQLARRHRGTDAVLGLTPALRRVEALAAQGMRLRVRRLLVRGPSFGYAREAVLRRIKGYGRAAARHATGASVQGTRLGRAAWQSALAGLPMPARARLPLARRVADGMARAGYAAEAGSTLTAAVRRVPQPRRRARFLSTPALTELTAGRIPPYLEEAAAAELACADAQLAHSPGPAAAAAHRAAKLLFHRVLHYDSLTSPAAPDPGAFFAPWHRSATGRALAAPRGRSVPAAPPPAGRPVRLLFLYRINDNFLSVLRDRYAARDDVEVRSVNVHDDDRLESAAIEPQHYTEHVLGGSPDYAGPVAEVLRPHLDWADTVFVDWFSPAAGLLTLLDPGRTRVVVRLHSFEVFDIWPHLADLSRVDDLVFVSEHLRAYARAILPGLGGPGRPRTHVLPHPADLSGFDRPKPPEARFALGLIGVSAVAKDPRWAFEVLRLLRAGDERYHLRLIGADVRGDTSAAARRYRRAYEEDLAAFPPGAVRRLGQTDDVPAALTAVGTILSSSVRESFHWGLAEGAASHAVPVVRDWPFFPGAAAQLFPPEWVVSDPAAAAARIVAATATEEVWRKAGAEAAAHARVTWDHAVAAEPYDRLFGIRSR